MFFIDFHVFHTQTLILSHSKMRSGNCIKKKKKGKSKDIATESPTIGWNQLFVCLHK